jgi:hypothetical protein
MRYTQTFLKIDAHFANQIKTTVCHAPHLPHWERKKKKKKEWVKEKKGHKKDEAQEAVIDSFGKIFATKNLELFFLACKLD